MRRLAESHSAGLRLSRLTGPLLIVFILLSSFGYGQDLQCQLEPIPADFASVAAINNSDEAVGWYFAGTGNHAFKFTRGKVIDLGTLGGSYSRAWNINVRGHVVGEAATGGGYIHAFLFSGSEMRDLGTLDTVNLSAWSIAYGINDHGLIVGQASTGNTARAFLYEHGRFRDLGTLGGSWSLASAINDQGVIVGRSAMPGDGSYHATQWEKGRITDLGTLGGSLSVALAVNDSGRVVGTSTIATGEWHAFSYERGEMSDLGSVAGGSVMAKSINRGGWAVGHAEFGPAVNQHTPLLFAAGRQFDLAHCASGHVLFSAADINAKGHIAADGMDEDSFAVKAYVVRLLSEPSP